MTQVDTQFVDKVVARIGRGPEKLIAILQAIQAHYRYLPQEATERICAITDITPSTVAGVSTFYSQFRHRPSGLYTIRVCHGTACHVKGAARATDALREHLKLKDFSDTDSSGLFTVDKVACLGCCTLAPVVQIEDVTYGHVTAEMVPGMLRDFLELKHQQAKKRRGRPRGATGDGLSEIRIGLGSCCVARGSGRVYEALNRALAETAAPAKVKVVGCVGLCHQTPMVEFVMPDGRSFLYARVQPADARAIVLRHFRAAGPAGRVRAAFSNVMEKLLTDETWQGPGRYSMELRDPAVAAFLGPQKRIATELSGQVSPDDLEEYLSTGGFEAFRKALDGMSPEQVCRVISESHLRGRGGAGFPTGVKWSTTRQSGGEKKFIVCNGDEGDPGAFMDRMLLESYPYRVIEGMMIAGYAVGASQGYLYIRAEYPTAIRRVKAALEGLTERGLLGREIAGSGYCLQLEVMEAAGAFVCGEETALLASIEGRRGTPRLRPPYPSQSGLWGMPTLVNNVETFCVVPWIIRNGAEAFASLGTATSKGTKVFALAGKVARGGLVEVPMGVTIRQIVQDIGGGVCPGRQLKAVQVGGPSGGCVPASLADTPIDYEALQAVGAIMGSGGLVVMDDLDCMVDIARYFLAFTQDQSCGKCTLCRVGTRRMLDILNRLCDGSARPGDLEMLDDLARTVKAGSLCGLGKTAPNPVLSTLKYFRDEYEAHLAGRCPAAVCKALITYSITDDCIGCTRCAQNCPADAIEMHPYEKQEIDTEKCIRCGTCKTVCPVEAVAVQ